MIDLPITLSTADYSQITTSIQIVQNDFATYRFVFFGIDLSEYTSAVIKFEPESGEPVIDSDLIIGEDTVIYVIKNSVISAPGQVDGTISLYKDGSRITTNKFIFRVLAEISSEGAEADDRLPVLDAKILEVQELHTQAEEINGNTAEVNANALQIAEDVDTAKQDAEQAASAASQALADLLAMMGVDIATLTGGKLTPSQIPAIAVTDTFVCANEAEMLALTAETGDIAIRTDESKSYILQGTNPSVLTDWKQLQVPTNYADTAGHANTADNATNATMINNHRIVVMTQAQYDIAVKDPDTVYLVGV